MSILQTRVTLSHCAVEASRRSNEKYTLFSAKDFPNLPEMAWLIKHILPASGLASVYGPSGVGKSFLLLDIAASVACGIEWFGHPTNQCQVVYIVLEGQAGFRRRVAAWAIQHDMEFPEAVQFVFDPFALNTTDDANSLGNLITQCGGAGLIIIDTLNKAAPGADENSSSDMGKILAGASALQEATGGLVVLVHHPGKDVSRGLRGHSSLYAALDAVIGVDQDGERKRWTLAKSKDGEDGISHAFDLAVVELENAGSGKAVTSCVVVAIEGCVINLKQKGPRGTNQKLILSAFTELLLQERMLCAATDQDWPEGIPFDEAVDQLKDRLESVDQNHRQARTKEAVERLVEMGYLIVNGELLTQAPTKSTQGGSK